MVYIGCSGASEAPFASDERYLQASSLIGREYMRICFKLAFAVVFTNRKSCVFHCKRSIWPIRSHDLLLSRPNLLITTAYTLLHGLGQ